MNTEPIEMKRSRRTGGGMLVAGITLIGLGLGLAFDFMPAGLLFGLGVGIIAEAIWRNRRND